MRRDQTQSNSREPKLEELQRANRQSMERLRKLVRNLRDNLRQISERKRAC